MNFFLKIYFSLYFLQCFSNSLLAGFGLGFPNTTFLFEPIEIFSDFVRVSYSYPFLLAGKPSSWFETLASRQFPGLAAAFERYRHESLLSFQSDPQWLTERVTHFHHPPVTQLHSLLFGGILHQWGPFTAIVITCIVCLLPLVVASVMACHRFPRYAPWLLGVSLISYPAVFAITRGNFTGLFCSTLLVLAILLIASEKVNLAIVCSAMALSIRPNWYPLVLVMLFVLVEKVSLGRKLWIFLRWLLVLAVVNMVALAIVHAIYPAYDLQSFLEGYRKYSAAYEFGDTGSSFGSSLLVAEKEVLSVLFHVNSLALLGILRRLNIVLASLAVVWLIALAIQKRVSQETALVLAMALTILGTPVFFDYHLFVLWGAIYYALYRSRDSQSIALSRLDLAFIAISLSPFAYYLRPGAITGFGVLFRPFVALLYVFICFVVVSRPALGSASVQPLGSKRP